MNNKATRRGRVCLCVSFLYLLIRFINIYKENHGSFELQTADGQFINGQDLSERGCVLLKKIPEVCNKIEGYTLGVNLLSLCVA